jgi:hypothetical protein
MARKPPVEVSKRFEWLRLVEEEHKTVPGIAKEEGFDVRTIRKNIQWARDERERREARVNIFRQAQQDHYSDLVSFVDKLDSEINREKSISPLSKSERLWKALRQHLPRSPLWKLIDKLDSTNNDVRKARNKLQKKVAEMSPDNIVPKIEDMGLNREAVEGVLVDWSEGTYGVGTPKLEARQSRQGYKDITFGNWNCSTTRDKKAKSVEEYISNLMVEAAALPEAQQLRDLLAKRQEITDSIGEELATIKLKRIVPGRCKYCPL